MNLIRQLEKLGQDASGIRSLNGGGCAVYAAAVAKRLHALDVPVWGAVSMRAYDDPENVDLDAIRFNNRNNSNKLRTVWDWNEYGVGFHHVLVQFVHEGKIWTHDSNGTVPKPVKVENTCGGIVVNGHLTVAELVSIASRQAGWSSAFNRRTGIPAIKRCVARHLSIEALE